MVHSRWLCAVGWSLLRCLKTVVDKDAITEATSATAMSGLTLLAPVRRLVIHLHPFMVDGQRAGEIQYEMLQLDTSVLDFDQAFFGFQMGKKGVWF